MLTKLRPVALATLAVVSLLAVPAAAEERIVYVRGVRQGLTDDLFTIRPDGSGVRRLTKTRAVERWPQWSPDRTRIAFERATRDGNVDVWVMDADGSNERRLTASPRDDIRPRWSPDGRWISWLHGRRERYIGQIRMMRPDGSGKRPLVRRALSVWDWSPDGTKIAFTRRDRCSECYFEDYEVNVVDVRTGVVRRLTRNRRTQDGGGLWSPDGRRLAFFREPFRRYPRLYTMKPDGSHQRKVGVVKLTVSSAQWSPDGRKILMSLRDGNVFDPERISLLDVATGRRRTVSDWSNGFARWSPDGRRIAYTAPALVDGENGHALFSVRRDLSGRKRVIGTRRGLGLFDW